MTCCSTDVRVDDIGIAFKITIVDCDVPVNISAVSTKQILFYKPDGTVLTKTASFFTDGTDGILTYATVAGDLNAPGFWRIEAYIVLGASQYYSEIARFRVYNHL